MGLLIDPLAAEDVKHMGGENLAGEFNSPNPPSTRILPKSRLGTKRTGLAFRRSPTSGDLAFNKHALRVWFCMYS